MYKDLLSLIPQSGLSTLPSIQAQLTIPNVIFSHQKQVKFKWNIKCEGITSLLLQYQWLHSLNDTSEKREIESIFDIPEISSIKMNSALNNIGLSLIESEALDNSDSISTRSRQESINSSSSKGTDILINNSQSFGITNKIKKSSPTITGKKEDDFTRLINEETRSRKDSTGSIVSNGKKIRDSDILSVSTRSKESSLKNSPMSPNFQLEMDNESQESMQEYFYSREFDLSTVYEYMYLGDELWTSLIIESQEESQENLDVLNQNKNNRIFKGECTLEVPKYGSGKLVQPITLLVRIGVSKKELMNGELISIPLHDYRNDFLGTPYEWTQFSKDDRECITLYQESRKIQIEHALATRCISSKTIHDRTFIQIEIENLTKTRNLRIESVLLHLNDSRCLKAISMDEIASIIVSEDQTIPSQDQFSLSSEDIGILFQAVGPMNFINPEIAPGEKYCAFFTIEPVHSYQVSERKLNVVQNNPLLQNQNLTSRASSRNESRRSTFIALSKLSTTLKKGLNIQTGKRSNVDYDLHRTTLSTSPTLQKALSKSLPPKMINNSFEFESKVNISYTVVVDKDNNHNSLAGNLSPVHESYENNIECESIYFLQWIALLPRGYILRVRLPEEIYSLKPFLVDIWVYNCTGHPNDLIFTVPTDCESKFLCSDTQSHLGVLESNEGHHLRIQFTAIEKGIQDLNLMYLVEKQSKDEYIFPTSIYVSVK